MILVAVLQVLTPTLPALDIGRPIGEQSQAVQTLITPGGWAFSVWGLPYAGSFVFAADQALGAQRDNTFFAQLRWPAAGAFAGNAIWAAYRRIVAWSQPMPPASAGARSFP